MGDEEDRVDVVFGEQLVDLLPGVRAMTISHEDSRSIGLAHELATTLNLGNENRPDDVEHDDVIDLPLLLAMEACLIVEALVGECRNIGEWDDDLWWQCISRSSNDDANGGVLIACC